MQAKNTQTWVHILLKGEQELDDSQLRDEYIETFASRSQLALRVPVLKFEYTNLCQVQSVLTDLISSAYEQKSDVGLIFTSPRSVESVSRALVSEPAHIAILPKLDPKFVFVVGQKSGYECKKKLGLEWNVESSRSGSSAELAGYIREIAKSLEKPLSLLYPKSSLADNKIEESLLECNDNISIVSIVSYETKAVDDIMSQMVERLTSVLATQDVENLLVLNIIFFSPSGIEAFFRGGTDELMKQLCERLPQLKCQQIEFRYSAIGTTTSTALARCHLDLFCVADQPNANSLVDNIVRAREAEDKLGAQERRDRCGGGP